MIKVMWLNTFEDIHDFPVNHIAVYNFWQHRCSQFHIKEWEQGCLWRIKYMVNEWDIKSSERHSSSFWVVIGIRQNLFQFHDHFNIRLSLFRGQFWLQWRVESFLVGTSSTSEHVCSVFIILPAQTDILFDILHVNFCVKTNLWLLNVLSLTHIHFFGHSFCTVVK